jgi:hypothetical protein
MAIRVVFKSAPKRAVRVAIAKLKYVCMVSRRTELNTSLDLMNNKKSLILFGKQAQRAD